MKINIQILNYGGSKKMMVTLTSEIDPKLEVVLTTYFAQDVVKGAKLLEEISEEKETDNVQS